MLNRLVDWLETYGGTLVVAWLAVCSLAVLTRLTWLAITTPL